MVNWPSVTVVKPGCAGTHSEVAGALLAASASVELPVEQPEIAKPAARKTTEILPFLIFITFHSLFCILPRWPLGKLFFY